MKANSILAQNGTRKIIALVTGLLGLFIVVMLLTEGNLKDEQGAYLLSIFSCSTTFLFLIELN